MSHALHPMPIKILRHARARRMILRLASDGASLELTLPKRVSEKTGMAFVAEQQAWIARQISKHSARETTPLLPEVSVLLFGQECVLKHEPEHKGISYLTRYEAPTEQSEAQSVGFGENSPTMLVLGRDASTFPRRVEEWIKKEARLRFSEIAVEVAAQIGQRPSSVTLRDTKSRWGSCSKRRSISLSWRLAFAPAEVARYVIVHEVAHLAHFDHSPAFWKVVEQLDPNWRKSRDWLKAFGKKLHDYGG
jgi:hypothetical protein